MLLNMLVRTILKKMENWVGVLDALLYQVPFLKQFYQKSVMEVCYIFMANKILKHKIFYC